MSRSNAPRQDTLNRWVNTGAVAAYTDKLDAQAGQIENHAWLDGMNRPEALAHAALTEAAAAMRQATDMARRAERLADAVWTGHLYGWDHEHCRWVFGTDAAEAEAQPERQPFGESR